MSAAVTDRRDFIFALARALPPLLPCAEDAYVGELALAKIDLADRAEVHNAVLTVHELLEQAAALLDGAEYDYAESACERVEVALIALRRAARQTGVVV